MTVVVFPGALAPDDPRAVLARAACRAVAARPAPCLAAARRQALPLLAVVVLAGAGGLRSGGFRPSDLRPGGLERRWAAFPPPWRADALTTLWMCADIEITGIPAVIGGRDGGLWRLSLQGPDIGLARVTATPSGCEYLGREAPNALPGPAKPGPAGPAKPGPADEAVAAAVRLLLSASPPKI